MHVGRKERSGTHVRGPAMVDTLSLALFASCTCPQGHSRLQGYPREPSTKMTLRNVIATPCLHAGRYPAVMGDGWAGAGLFTGGS
jgi:hypothetical protein